MKMLDSSFLSAPSRWMLVFAFGNVYVRSYIAYTYISQVTWEKFKISNASNDAIGSFFRAKFH